MSLVKPILSNKVSVESFELPRKDTIMYFISEILWTLKSNARKGISGVHLKGIFDTLELKFSQDKLLKLMNRCLKNMFELGMLKKTSPQKFLLTKEYRKFLNSNKFFQFSDNLRRVLGGHGLKC